MRDSPAGTMVLPPSQVTSRSVVSVLVMVNQYTSTEPVVLTVLQMATHVEHRVAARTSTTTSGIAVPLMATGMTCSPSPRPSSSTVGGVAGLDHVLDAVDRERGGDVVAEVLEEERHGAVERHALLRDGDPRRQVAGDVDLEREVVRTRP